MKRALVTGAAGFIGSHLVTRLLRGGWEVWAVDDFSSGRRENFDAAVADVPGAVTRFFCCDLADSHALPAVLDGVEAVFHLAALADIVPSIQQPLRYHRANVEGTVRLLEAIRRVGSIEKLVYAASSSCYGIPDEYPTPETAPIRPQYPYALTKTIAEQYVLHWGQVYGIPVVSLRLFNVYGPRARTNGTYGAVFGVFLAQKLAGRPLTVVGDGTQTRDFIYVTDVCEAFARAAESDVRGEVFNVGTGRPQSINRLCELLGGLVEHIPRRPGEPDCTWADVDKIRRVLGWEPSVPFEEGVARMLETIDAWAEAPVWTPQSIARATADWFRYLQDPCPQHA
ncbi:MAG: SDR family oxidoreductase [Planctomycetota bacterium]|nr:MAG: SDR family oxidoreductase [Planctomycetota bacterium]